MPDPTSARRVLVAGGTGLVGRALISQLLAEGGLAVEAVWALRRPSAAAHALPKDRRLHWIEADFARLPALPAVDEVLIALGTTIRVAGSQAAFRAVDFDAVLAVARAGRDAGAQVLGVVSALGADPQSRVFYNRVKGEMEAAVAGLGYRSVTIAQPSLIVGDRAALGQPQRPAEGLGLRLLRPVAGLIPRAWRPIAAEHVAQALREAVRQGADGVRRLSSGDMQR